MQLERRYFRAMILYDFMRGLSASQSHDQLNDVIGDQSPSVQLFLTGLRSSREEGGHRLMRNALNARQLPSLLKI